jgi:hypothetical protein
MSSQDREKEERNRSESDLEHAQKDQDRTGKAGSNPNTTGPAENLREKAAKAEDKSEGSEEPV